VPTIGIERRCQTVGSSGSGPDGQVRQPLPHTDGIASARHTALHDVVGALARDVFPMIKAVRDEPHRVDPGPLPHMSGLWTAIARAILQSRIFAAAALAAQEDPVIGAAITAERGYVGSAIGGGGVLQAETLPLNLVQAACLELLVCGREFTVAIFANTATKNVDKLKTGLSGGEIEGWAVTSFSALQLSPGSRLSTPWGDLVHADRLTAEIWQSPTDRVTAVLATPLATKLVAMDPSTPQIQDSFFPRAYRIAQLVSYGIALGSIPDDPAGAVHMNIGGLLPWGMPGWGGEVRMVGFTSRSTPLTDAERTQATRWMTELDQAPIDRIEVALRRLVRALAERQDPSDQLIDAVIAWENLVEHRDRPTSSVLWGIRTLATPAGWSRKRIEGVYKTRSNIVHGEAPDYVRIRADAPEAIRIGLDSVRRLVTHYPDTLQITSEARVVALGYADPTTPRGRLLTKVSKLGRRRSKRMNKS
jgi:hypothetical protein